MSSTSLVTDFLFGPNLALYDLLVKPYRLGWRLVTKNFTEEELLFQKLIIGRQYPILENKIRLITTIAGCVLMCPLINTIAIIFFRYYFKNYIDLNNFFTLKSPVDTSEVAENLSSPEGLLPSLPSLEKNQISIEWAIAENAVAIIPNSSLQSPVDTGEVAENLSSPEGLLPSLPSLEKSQISIERPIAENAVAMTFYWPLELDDNGSCEVKNWILKILKEGDKWLGRENPIISLSELLQLEACVSQINFSNQLKEEHVWIITKCTSNITSCLKDIMDQSFERYITHMTMALMLVPYEKLGTIYLAQVPTNQLEQPLPLRLAQASIQQSKEVVKNEIKRLEAQGFVNPILCIAIGIYFMENSDKKTEDFEIGISFYARGLYLLKATYDALKTNEKENVEVQSYISSTLNQLPPGKKRVLNGKKEQKLTKQSGDVMLDPYWLLFFKAHLNLSKDSPPKSPQNFDMQQLPRKANEIKQTFIKSRKCTNSLERKEYMISYKELREAGVIS